MQRLRVRIRPEGAFGDPVRGDTLFGQLCWSIRQRFGNGRLRELLDGYLDGKPFLVFSDAFPSGYLPRPALPLGMFDVDESDDRKRLRGLRWLPLSAFGLPARRWLSACVNDAGAAEAMAPFGNAGEKPEAIWKERSQPHNTLHRLSNSTRSGEFAPYQAPALWPAPGLRLDIWALVDESRLALDELEALLADVGMSGYGRDASIGHGRFSVEALDASAWPEEHQDTDAWLTLAPCAPQGLEWQPERCFWRPFTRFGRHGQSAIFSGRPFKNPVLLADTGAVLTPASLAPASYTGQGLGGSGKLSRAIPETVHQGYAPVMGIRLGGEA